MISAKIKQLRNSTSSNGGEVAVNLETPMLSLKSEIKRLLDNPNIPTSRNGLLELAKEKNKALNGLLSVNLAKKENKAIDLLCEYRFDIQGGYQTFKSSVEKAKESILKDFKYIETSLLPEVMILGYNPDTDVIYDISQVDCDFTIKKYSGWEDGLYPHGWENDNDELNERGYAELSEEDLNAITSFYSITDISVDTGTDAEGYGFGNMDNDIRLIKELTGLHIVAKDYNKFEYFSFEGNDRPYFIMVISRPSNENIAKIKQDIINYE